VLFGRRRSVSPKGEAGRKQTVGSCDFWPPYLAALPTVLAPRTILGVALCLSCFASALGCATTVARLDGEVTTSAGPAKNLCEQKSWLVIAPTRTETLAPGSKRPTTNDDGIGLYRVGASKPESIVDLGPDLGESPMITRHAQEVRRHDDKRVLAAGIGGAGIVALGIGTVLFVSSFETETTTRVDGTKEESQVINGGRAAAGGLVFALGVGLGIAGLAINPSQAERSHADAWRYAFRPPEDDTEAVKKMVDQHNVGVRERCENPAAQ
jgi:hypothetical protein